MDKTTALACEEGKLNASYSLAGRRIMIGLPKKDVA